jgi:hypothetical protein
MISKLVAWALAGVIATLAMDVLGGVSRRLGLGHGVPPPLIGRWFMQVLRGRPFVADVRALPGPPPFMPLVLAIHFGIGVSLAVVFGLAAPLLGARAASPWVAFAFGVGTTVLPYFWMFPGMGFGVLGLAGPKEWKLARTALVNHVFYGLGLAFAAYEIVPRLVR